jgi:hypothetical protein
MRDVRGNLDAAQVGPLEADAVIGGRRFEGQRHLAAGMKPNSGAIDGSTKGALCRHQVTVTDQQVSKASAKRVEPGK